MPHVALLCGPVRSGKSAEIVRRYQATVDASGRSPAALILPNAHRVETVRQGLLLAQGLPGLLAPRILTFPELATQVLDAAGIPAPPIPVVGERAILRLVVQRIQNRLRSFTRVSRFPGFIDSLSDLIGELKRIGVDPATFRARLVQAGALDDRGQDIADLFHEYQECLRQLGAFDVEGRFWAAREAIRSPACPFPWPPHVLVDGFENFTTTQLDMLEALADHADSTLITLTLDPGDPRRDLFAMARRTYESLRTKFPDAVVMSAPGAAIRLPPAVDHLARNLFHPSPNPVPAPPGIQIVETPGRRREIEAMAREIKRLLTQGTPPEQVGVVFRSLDDYGDILREVFARAGIPTRLGQWVTAQSQTVCHTVMSLLRIAVHDFRRDDVIQFLKSSYVRFDPWAPSPPGSGGAPSPDPSPEPRDSDAPPETPGNSTFTPDDLEDLARRARITGGEEEWLTRLQAAQRRWQNQAQDASSSPESDYEEPPGALTERSRLASLAVTYFTAFRDRIRRLPQEAALPEHVQAILEVIEGFCIPTHLVDPEVPASSALNVQAFQELLGVLDDLAATGALLEKAEGRPVRVSLAEFARDLRTGLGYAVFQAEGSRQGRVAILEAHQARQLTFPYLFLGGLVEKEFPRTRREDPFYRDRERRQLSRAGLPLDEKLPQQREEMILLYGAVCAAEGRLYLSYPVTDAEGREVLTSHYVDEIRRCFSSPPETRRDRLSNVVPPFHDAFHPLEVLERSFLMSGSSRTPPPADDLASLLQEHRPTSGILSRHPDDPLRNALAGAEGERHRYALAPFDAFDGVIHDPSAREHIARQFGHRHRFSPKQLNAMGACPFQFFAAYGLGLGPEEDKTDEADDLERGLAAHAILREFFTDARTHTGAATITSDRIDSARELLVRITERFFSRQIGLGLVGDPALWRAEQRTMLRHLISVLENEARMNAEDSQAGRTFTPMYLEYAYGRRGEPPLRWQDPSGDFEIAGRIDRIDVCTNSASGHLFRVWDYKLGSGHRAQDALTGTDFQLPIYVLAAQQNLFHGQGRCVTCGYYRVRRPVGPEGTASSEGRKASLDDILQAARTRIGALVRQIRAADFRVRPAQFDRCPRCDFRGICRVERFRAARKERPCPGTP